MKSKRLSLLFVFCLSLIPVFGQNQALDLAVSFHSLRLNVADKVATAKWYSDNVGLDIVPTDNKDIVYVADKDRNSMIGFSSLLNLRTTYTDIHIDAFHVAFEGLKSIEQVGDRVLANGASVEGAVYRNKIGDYVLNVRDPNGFCLQFIHRVKPFYQQPQKSPIRFEHFAFNTPDQKIAALWYEEFMNLTLPWSKDIDTTANNYRNYRVPYVGDYRKNMTFELFGKKDVDCTLSKMNHDEVHIAFTTDEPEALAKRMIYGGSRQVAPARTEADGNIVIDLFDPRNIPIRLIGTRSVK